MTNRRLLAPILAALALTLSLAAFLSGVFTSEAVQNPSVSFDMIPAGNTYDETTNSMTIGPINNCLVTAPPGNSLQHIHLVHFVIQNVEDLVGWQARMNYTGNQFRPNTVSFTPFTDNNTGQTLSFLNLPIDQVSFVHRDQVTATSIPASAPGPQTALVGSVYQGSQDFAISPDTPAKAVPDDTSYSTSGGGVLASMNLSVVGNQAGQSSLFIDLDDASPNGPGTDLQIFTTGGLMTISPPVSQLGDAIHAEGGTPPPQCAGATATPSPTPPSPTPTATASPTATATATPCPGCTPTPSATTTATPTATANPAAGHDARLTRIGGVPKNVRLLPGEVITDSASILVANESNHTETIGVYVDVSHPTSGCTPNGRVLQTTVALVAGAKTTVPVPVNYSCSNPAAADGLSYTWTAVADHGADDLSSCGAGALLGLACFNALADDDEDPADNRRTRTGPKVVAQ